MHISDRIVVHVYKCSPLNEMLSGVAKYSKEQALNLSFAPFRQEDNIKACREKDPSGVGP